MLQKAVAGVVVAIAAFTASMGVAAGHAPPPEHNHFLTVPGTGAVVQVGPHVCSLPQTHRAFHNFHDNVHVGQPSEHLTISRVLCD